MINRLKLFDYTLKFILFTCAFLIFLVHTPNAYLSTKLSRKLKLTVNSLNKQGWSFFTKNPRDQKMIVYTIEQKNLIDKTIPNFSVVNLFGLDRIQRKLGAECEYILSKIDSTKFQIIQKKDLGDSIRTLKNFIPFKKDKYCENIAKGYYLFCIEDQIPFAYYKYTDLNGVKEKTYKILIY